jgi:hypothetical protein
MRKSEISSLRAFRRAEVTRRRETGSDEVSIITVVFGGNDIAWETRRRAAACIRWREMEERTEDVRSEV